jgi:hypothetical protein
MGVVFVVKNATINKNASVYREAYPITAYIKCFKLTRNEQKININ